ncbi:MAG TPA: carbamoyltransferase HypF [Clostridia bacterium]|nr:carbamoyltransferase HypF [Clostridia bacterium]
MAERAGSFEKVCHYDVTIEGIVQGVGFRPYVYNLARRYGLAGNVRNTPKGVLLEVEGQDGRVVSFLNYLKHNPPRLARITSMAIVAGEFKGYEDFRILDSSQDSEKRVLISPDVALCEECRSEILSPGNRRYLYPFTNCTNCGPRYTIIEDVPYDRGNTSMKEFRMCPACELEYHDPCDRRFHAQPNACPVCGPQVAFVWAGRESEEHTAEGLAEACETREWLRSFRQAILDGRIVAVKGIGGFHLACDAMRGEVVEELRRRKRRPAKPLAVMFRDIEAVRRYCEVSPIEEAVLCSPEAPIVILRSKGILPPSISPNKGTVGAMLPYTPLHVLLFAGGEPDGFDALVMTSGNKSDLPIAIDEAAALRDLAGIADCFIFHDRPIVNRCDDSVVRVIEDEVHCYRRSRGYVPRPVHCNLPGPMEPVVLGVGGEINNTFCILRGYDAFLGPHIGDTGVVETLEHFQSSLKRYLAVLGVTPEVIAYDPHPGYFVSAYAKELASNPPWRRGGNGASRGLQDTQAYKGVRVAESAQDRGRAHSAEDPVLLIPVQHHHAHMAAAMAENGIAGPVVGLICDGTGYGPDGTLWGCEVLFGDLADVTREAHLEPVPLLGGEAAIREPWRMAVSYLIRALGHDEGKQVACRLFPNKRAGVDMVARMCETGFNSPRTSGLGRLFDAVSAIAGICLENTYEGQAAIELGEAAEHIVTDAYPYGGGSGPSFLKGGFLPSQKRTDGHLYPDKTLPETPATKAGTPMPVSPPIAGTRATPASLTTQATPTVISVGPIIREVLEWRMRGAGASEISARFHLRVAEAISRAALSVCRMRGVNTLALAGGCFQNIVLFSLVKKAARAEGINVIYPRMVPTNDAGLALGQAVVARWRFNRELPACE